MQALLSFVDLIDAVAFAIIAAYLYGVFLRSMPAGMGRNLLIGTVFGLMGWIAMLSPVALSNGVYVDLRPVFFVLPAAFAGLTAGLMAFALVVFGGFAFFPFPALGWSFVAWQLASFTLQISAAFVWRYVVLGRLPSRQVVSAALLVMMVAAAAVVGSNWSAISRFPGAVGHHILALMATAVGFFIGSLVMWRERGLKEREDVHRAEGRRDPLTGLLNRRGFEEAMERVSALGEDFAVYAFDMDRFKALNDQAGHGAGDAALAAVSGVLARVFGAGAILSRMGGDEFVVVVLSVSEPRASALGQRVVDTVPVVPVADVPASALRLSGGVVMAHPGEPLRKWLHLADMALYQAKSEGGDRLVLAPTTPRVKVKRGRMALV